MKNLFYRYYFDIIYFKSVMFRIKKTSPLKNVMPNVLYNFKVILIFYEQLQNILDIKNSMSNNVCVSISIFKIL